MSFTRPSAALIRAVDSFNTQLGSALFNGCPFGIHHESPETMVAWFDSCDEHGYDLIYRGWDWSVGIVDGKAILVATEVSCDSGGNWSHDTQWEIETPKDLKKVLRYMAADTKRGFHTQYEYARYVLMDTYGDDPCKEFFAETPFGRMESAFRQLTSPACPKRFALKNWEVTKARARLHAAAITRMPSEFDQEAVS